MLCFTMFSTSRRASRRANRRANRRAKHCVAPRVAQTVASNVASRQTSQHSPTIATCFGQIGKNYIPQAWWQATAQESYSDITSDVDPGSVSIYFRFRYCQFYMAYDDPRNRFDVSKLIIQEHVCDSMMRYTEKKGAAAMKRECNTMS